MVRPIGIRAALVLALLTRSFIPGGGDPAFGEETPATATPAPDPELTRLEAELKHLEARKKIEKAKQEILEAEKAQLAAQLSGADVKALEGKTTVDEKATQEPVTVAYLALEAVARHIAQEAQAKVGIGGRIVIHHADQIATAAEYRAFVAQTEYLKKEYGEALAEQPKPPAGTGAMMALGTASAVARSAIDFLSLFRTDVQI